MIDETIHIGNTISATIGDTLNEWVPVTKRYALAKAIREALGITVEYGIRHYAYQGVTDEFETLDEALERINQMEEPDEWRIQTHISSEWKDLDDRVRP